MTYSEKLEDIPKKHLESLKTFLSEFESSNAEHTQTTTAAAETGVDISTVQIVFSELVNKGVLRAKVDIRCPYCDTHHGTFGQRSSVPDEIKRCFVCEDEFEMRNRSNWEVVYEVIDATAEFFPADDWNLKRYIDSEKDVSHSFFQNELERLRDMDTKPQERGRQFDYFIGLLFHQLEGTKVGVKDSTRTGEVDVYVSCRRSPDWLTGLVGQGTILENKWQQDAVQSGEIDNLHSKAQDLAFPCFIAYFISMNGFTTGSTGALATLQGCEDPRIVDFTEEDVIDMVNEGTPAAKLEERELI